MRAKEVARLLKSGELPACSCPTTDRKGQPLSLGDYVSQPAYPRGSMKGWITTSERAWCSDCQGAAWVVQDETDGKLYSLSSKALRQRKQKPFNESVNESIRTSEVRQLPIGSIIAPIVNGKPQTDFLVVVDRDGGVAPRSVIPPRPGEYSVDGESADQWGHDQWAVVRKGKGKLDGQASVDRAVTRWWAGDKRGVSEARRKGVPTLGDVLTRKFIPFPSPHGGPGADRAGYLHREATGAVDLWGWNSAHTQEAIEEYLDHERAR